MAPLRGVTTVTYRRTFADTAGGLDDAISPFLPSARGMTVKPSRLADVLPAANPPSLPVIPQIIGRDIEDILVLAGAIRELGYSDIDLNLGCPWRMVVKRGRGSALLREPDHVRTLVDRLHAEFGFRVSLKVRLGIETPDELPRFLSRLGDAPVSELIVHPRTADQMYEGRPQLDRLAALAADIRFPLGYSGDIRTPGDIAWLEANLPAFRHVLLGRGLISCPVLGRQIRGDSADPVDVIHRMHTRLFEEYSNQLSGTKPILGRMKELWFYMHQGFDVPERVYKRILRSTTVPAFTGAVARFFDTARWRGLSPGLAPHA